MINFFLIEKLQLTNAEGTTEYRFITVTEIICPSVVFEGTGKAFNRKIRLITLKYLNQS